MELIGFFPAQTRITPTKWTTQYLEVPLGELWTVLKFFLCLASDANITSFLLPMANVGGISYVVDHRYLLFPFGLQVRDVTKPTHERPANYCMIVQRPPLSGPPKLFKYFNLARFRAFCCVKPLSWREFFLIDLQ